MKKSDEKIELMTNKIQTINKHIDTFQEKIEKLPSDLSSDFKDTVDELKEKRLELDHKLDTIKGASGSARDDLQLGFQMAWVNLSNACDHAKKRFENTLS
jgi:chromosome segregation ATPase